MGMQKVVLFCRSATKEQVAFQQKRLMQYTKEHDCEVVAVVIERRSGVSARRWKLNLSMRLAVKNAAGILMVDISRVSRLHKVAEKFARQLHRRKIKLYTMPNGVEEDQVGIILRYSKLAGLESAPIVSMV